MTDMLTVTQTQVVEAIPSKPDRCAKRIYHKDSDIDGSYYIREDIHEAELTKLRNALDVAEKALAQWVSYTGGQYDPIKERISEEALTAIKQARGE